MSIFLEFPSIEDYPVYSLSSVTEYAEGALIHASAFNWLLTLEFSALRSAEDPSEDSSSGSEMLENPIG